MKENTSVVVSVDGEVWGTWTIDEKLTTEEQQHLRRKIQVTLKKSNSHFASHIDFIQNVECDNFSELMAGIVESVNFELDEEID